MTTRPRIYHGEAPRCPLWLFFATVAVLGFACWLHDRAGEREARQAQAERTVRR